MIPTSGKPLPAWVTQGVCGTHSVVPQAERVMRDGLARTTLADLIQTVWRKALSGFDAAVGTWLSAQVVSRRSSMRYSDVAEARRTRLKRQSIRPRRSIPIRRILLVAAGAFIATSGVSAAITQTTKVTPLISRDLTGIPGKQGAMLEVDYLSGGSDPVHRHDAYVFGYVLKGSVVMQVKGGQRLVAWSLTRCILPWAQVERRPATLPFQFIVSAPARGSTVPAAELPEMEDIRSGQPDEHERA